MGGEGTREKGREGEGRKGQEGEKGRVGTVWKWGRGEGRVGPQARAWLPELFSWRRRCGKRILDFLLVLTELRNIE